MHIGTILLYVSFAVSVILFILCCISVVRKKEYKFTENLFYISGFFVSMALILLFAAFVRDRFDIGYVYDYSSKALPLYYKIAGAWAGQEGTFLLWAFFLFIAGSIVLNRRDKYTEIVLSIIVLTQALILFTLLLRSPFEYIWNTYQNISPGMPSDGSGLNPLLQDPWMVIHPPALFMGYASATVPYAYAVAALVKNDYSSWIAKSYKWVIFCFVSLGAGIFLGAYWAYKVLGWGGYWGWDPVENSSLIPWLTVTALMHGMIMQRRKNALVKTNIFLAAITLALVFYGTFLTRSGVLSDFSVHSFSGLGMKAYLGLYILIFLFPAVILSVIRRKSIAAAPLPPGIFAAGNIPAYGIVMLLLYAFFILIGTSMPILSDVFMKGAAGVGEGYYTNISGPFGILILLLLIASAMSRPNLKGRAVQILLISAAALVSGVLINLFQSQNAYAYIFSILGFFLVFQNIAEMAMRRFSGAASRIAHFGIGILVIGFVTTNMHSYSIQKELYKDTEVEINNKIKLVFLGEKETALEFLYQNNGRKKIIQIPYYLSEKTNSLIRKPYVDHGIRDVYLSPVEYKDGLSSGRHVLSRGIEKAVEGIKIRFDGFDMDKTEMTSGNARLSAKLRVNAGGWNYTLLPALLIKGDNKRENIDVVIPRLNRKLSLVDFDIANKEILIYIEPDKDKIQLKESVILDISFKRLVWLVWAGTVLIAAGGIIALKKRKAA